MDLLALHRDSRAEGGDAPPYRLHAEIGSGGMAAIHLGEHVASSRIVAVKRLHPQFAKDPEFVAMFLDEARVALRIAHPNVIRVRDVVVQEGELLLVMDYVLGAPLSLLLRRSCTAQVPVPVPIVARILVDVLSGLHAAHETNDEEGRPLNVVHRDVSPQNVLIGQDGVSRVFDFGIAKARGRAQTSQKGQLKGKLSYIAPEQIHEEPVSRKADIYAASVVLWEALTGRRLFRGDDDCGTLAQVLAAHVPPPSASAPGLSDTLDAIVLRGLDRVASNRYETAEEMAQAIGAVVPLASHGEVGAWVASLAEAEMASTEALITALESACDGSIEVDLSSLDTPSQSEVTRSAVVLSTRAPRRASILALAALVEIVAILLGVWLASGMHAPSAAAKAGYATDSMRRRTQ